MCGMSERRMRVGRHRRQIHTDCNATRTSVLSRYFCFIMPSFIFRLGALSIQISSLRANITCGAIRIFSAGGISSFPISGGCPWDLQRKSLRGGARTGKGD